MVKEKMQKSMKIFLGRRASSISLSNPAATKHIGWEALIKVALSTQLEGNPAIHSTNVAHHEF
jgi:hypothetical protein